VSKSWMVSLLPGSLGASRETPIEVALYRTAELCLLVQGLKKAWQGSYMSWQQRLQLAGSGECDYKGTREKRRERGDGCGR